MAQHNVPIHALKRGLVTESDLSLGALLQRDPQQRPGAMLVRNPLFRRANLHEPSLHGLLRDRGFGIDLENHIIQAGPFPLNHSPQVQFAEARSHVFAIITMWDQSTGRAIDRVLDPTLERRRFMPLTEVRERLAAPESWILTAPMLGRFRLLVDSLTPAQKVRLENLLIDQQLQHIDDADHPTHARIFRLLSNAPIGSLGDPLTWSYANNIHFKTDRMHDRRQMDNTGQGDGIRPLTNRLIEARQQGNLPLAKELADKIEQEFTRPLEIHRRLQEDATYSAHELAPLARLAAIVSAHQSLKALARSLQRQQPWPYRIGEKENLRQLRGFGIRLRQRIEQLALASSNEQGKIVACALNPYFFDACVETIEQMNLAGLTVFIDKVGNLHGLRLRPEQVDMLRQNQAKLSTFTRNAICHASHIDTVEDAGKHDGRLGVLAGIEIAKIYADLERYFDLKLQAKPTSRTLMVSAFMGEEMAYSGQGIAMPGSAAVAGLASIADVHEMTNTQGHRFGDKLNEMLNYLSAAKQAGKIDFFNDFPTPSNPDNPLLACSEPRDFFTPHTYERHIEQGPTLDRAQLPLVLVDRIMGIHQEDFLFSGQLAEQAGLEFNLRLRELSQTTEFLDIRITCGVLEPSGDTQRFDTPEAWKISLIGEMNHAGATATTDRHDPGVAAARIARAAFAQVTPSTTVSNSTPAKWIIGDIDIKPGANRNVIPGVATLIIARFPPNATDQSPDTQAEMALPAPLQRLLNQLKAPVNEGGEGIFHVAVESRRGLNLANRLRVSIDLRGAHAPVMQAFRQHIEQILRDIQQQFKVTTSAKIQQQVSPLNLPMTGQVLQLERSYGGSHNPYEAELAIDLLRGTMLQLETTQKFLDPDTPEPINLHQIAKQFIPKSWTTQVQSFVSGALHDTCNITKKTAQILTP